MKKSVGGVFLIMFFLGVVIAVSVADTNFITKPSASKNIVSAETPTNYLTYIFWILVAVIIIYILFKINCKGVRRLQRKKKLKKIKRK